MSLRRRLAVCVPVLAVLLLPREIPPATAQSAAPASIDREFTFAAGDVRVVTRAGRTSIEARSGLPEDRDGLPDLPAVSEVVELPAGMRATTVEVLDLETAPLAEALDLAPAVSLARNGVPGARSAPNAAAFARTGFQPESPVRMGYQGTMRERNLVYLEVWPARWDAGTRRAERVTRLRVRLLLEPGGPTPLARERVVPTWEGGAARAAAAPARSGGPAQPFRPTQVPSVLGSPVAYVIVTGDDQAAVYQQLADWKTQSGEPAVVRTMSFIRQQYPFGSDDAERVRRFIRDAYQRWGTQYVLLGGDTDVIPVRDAYTVFYGGESIASDLYYSCLDGNWNADGDSLYGEGYASAQNPGDNADLLPEVWVGRAPTVSAADAQLFVNKTLQYIRQPTSDYMDRFLFFAEVLFPQDWSSGQTTSLDGAELIEYDVLPVLDNFGSWIKYARLYENYTDARWRPGAIQETKATVRDSLNRGFNISVHVGHGYRTVMSCGDDNLTSNDAFSLGNGNRLTNLYAIDCTSNAIDFPCIGESFLLAPNGGAVTNIGSTRFDFPTTGRAYQQEYFRLLFQDQVTAIGEAQGRQKLPFLAQANYDGVSRWTQMTLLLLGDPSLRIYTTKPKALTVSAPSSIPLGSTSISVHVDTAGAAFPGAIVTAYKPGADLESAVTDGSGNAVVPFLPDSTGSMTLTVTGFNCKPYQATLPIVAAAGPALSCLAPAIDDDNTGGTSGNGDAIWDAGEVVDLAIPVRNNGGSSAPSVQGTLTTTDGMVTVVNGSVSYGTVAAGATSNPASHFRVTIAASCPDQREVPFTLTLVDGASHTTVRKLQLVVHAPDLVQVAHTVVDVGGNSDGRPDPGETCSMSLVLRNLGTGPALGLYGRLRQTDGLSTISDSTVAWSDLAPGQEATGDPVVFVPSSPAAKLELHVFDVYGERLVKLIDLSYPPTPSSLLALGAATNINLTWAHVPTADLLGYNVYRSSASGGPYAKVNPNPTDRVSYYLDEGLAPLTRYYYKIAAVDTSGNESSLSSLVSASTNPPTHSIFPLPTQGTTPSPVTIEHLSPGYPQDILFGSEVLYCLHEDGTGPVDADGAGTTPGDFTTDGVYYAGGASVADLDGNGTKEVVAATWTSQQLFAWDALGNLRAGFPVSLPDPIWSSVAIGDIDGDGHKEMVFGSRGANFYAFRDNGAEVMDGDANPATTGVFKVLGQPYNDGTPALADLDGDGKLDIIYGSYDGKLYAWRYNGTSLPGFPVTLPGGVSASVAVGYLDGPGDTQLDIVVATNSNNLTVIRADGTTHPGFPVFLRTNGTSRTPSPALADMNGDGYLDIVCAGTNGGMYVIDHNGNLVPPWNNIRYSTLTSSASESSPVVADINGDGLLDIVMGDETGNLTALSGGTGAVLPGFPIQLEAEVKGTPALCDCDGDGKTEIVVAGWDKDIHMWDYDYPFSPAGPPPWPQFHHDSQRTGYVGTPILLGVGDKLGAPATLELAAPRPNPARGAPRLAWGVPAGDVGRPVDLGVFDLSGRRVRTLASGPAHSGRFESVWDLRDAQGRTVANGVYFVRLSLAGRSESRKLAILR
jgi:hypothetical protein